MTQSPYSLDLATADFFQFPKLKTPMRGKRFAKIEEIEEKSKQKRLAIPKNVFQKCFEGWKKRWNKCIISETGYFEGDKIVINKQINTFWKNYNKWSHFVYTKNKKKKQIQLKRNKIFN